MECRKKIIEDLEEKGYLQKVDSYRHSIGHCYRCDTVIEPYLSKQWFVKIEELAKPAIDAVETDKTAFVPKRWSKVYFEWMYNIRDWCISRQLWWGHRIPVWYCQDCGEMMVLMDDPLECSKCHSKNIIQDKDVLDTWFSSALWPFSTLGWPEDTPDLEEFYPTSLLITGFDIIFFWVARMMMMGLKFKNDIPFEKVFINPLIKDIEGKKMSKSKGNVIDPLLMIDQYGADALRMTLAALTIQANYIRLAKEKIETFRNFTNKIWNVARFSLTHLEDFDPEEVKKDDLKYSLFDEWILYQLNNTVKKVTESLNNFKFSDAAMTIYDFSWNYFCDWYVELIKETLYSKDGTAEKKTAQYVLWFVLDNILRLLHPFMPFITEEIWQKIPHKELSISISSWPEYEKIRAKKNLEEKVLTIQEVIKTIRNIKAEMNIPLAKGIDVLINVVNNEKEELIEEHLPFIKNLAHVQSFQVGDSLEKPECSATGVLEDIEIFIPLAGVIDLEAEIQRLEKKVQKTEKDMIVINKKLNNADFIQKAPENIIKKEREKIKELTDIRDRIEKNLKALKSI